MVAASLLSTLLLAQALAVAAHPVEQKASLVTLPFSKRVSSGATNVVDHDQRRVINILGGKGQSLGNRADPSSSPADNRAVSYVATVQVGTTTNCK
jgi:hypothetical protein